MILQPGPGERVGGDGAFHFSREGLENGKEKMEKGKSKTLAFSGWQLLPSGSGATPLRAL